MAVATVGIVLLGDAMGSVAPAPALPSSVKAPGGLPPVPPLSPANLRALTYFEQASRSVRERDKSCVARPRRPLGQTKPDTGTPSRVILSTFGVLRRHPRSEPSVSSGGPLAGAYVNDVGVAGRRYGSVYEVVAVKSLLAGATTSARCQALELRALRAVIRHAPKRARARALRLGQDELLDERYIDHHPEGICLVGGGGADCGPFLDVQARGAVGSTGYGADGSSFDDVVPDGVASITAHYPAEGPKQGFRRHLPAVQVTEPVLNNVAVWRLAHEPGDLFPDTITWRSPSGHVVKTVYVG